MAATDILSDKAIKAALKTAAETGKARKLSDGGGLIWRRGPPAPAGGVCATGATRGRGC